MARLRFMAVAFLALALAGNSAQTGRTQTDQTSGLGNACSVSLTGFKSAPDDRSCVIYSLTDMGYDADLGTWIARTIPEMIEPNSWKESGGAGVLRYYAPKNILIVNHSAAVRSKVDDFLKKLKTSLPKTSRTKFAENKKPSRANVVPAEYRASAPMRTADPLPEASSYPVPAPVKAPKHLFHFLIRYEGEGIIDDNVVKFMKGYTQAIKDGNGQTPAGQITAQGSPDPAPPSSGGMYAGGASSGPSAPGTLDPAAMPDGSSGPPGEKLPMPKEDKKADRKKKSDKESP